MVCNKDLRPVWLRKIRGERQQSIPASRQYSEIQPDFICDFHEECVLLKVVS